MFTGTRIRKLLIVLAVLLASATVCLTLAREKILTAVGSFLLIEDPLARADAIVVLAGDSSGERESYAAQLYHQRLAPHIILSGGDLFVGTTWASLMKRFMVSKRVPEEVLIEEGRSADTFENACLSLPILEALGCRRILVVTSPYHTRRSRRIFRDVLGDRFEVAVVPARPSWFTPATWWKTRAGQRVVVLEYVKLLGHLVLSPQRSSSRSR